MTVRDRLGGHPVLETLAERDGTPVAVRIADGDGDRLAVLVAVDCDGPLYLSGRLDDGDLDADGRVRGDAPARAVLTRDPRVLTTAPGGGALQPVDGDPPAAWLPDPDLTVAGLTAHRAAP